MSNILPMAHLNVKFVFEGKTYDVEGFNLEFNQPIDYKGQPQHEIQGGQVMLTLTQIADKKLYLWGGNSTLLKNGKVLFQTDMGMTVMEIVFENAYCIQLYRSVSDGAATRTNMVISPEVISLNGKEHLNVWS